MRSRILLAVLLLPAGYVVGGLVARSGLPDVLARWDRRRRMVRRG